MTRTTKASLSAQGTSAFTRAIRSLGHEVDRGTENAGADLVVTVDGIEVSVEITAASVVTPDTVHRILASSPKHTDEVARIMVGDLITGPARLTLSDAGWGWLDLRGHTVLRAKGVHIDADVPADKRPTSNGPPKPISGAASISLAAALLMSPEDPPSMRAVARRVSLSHSAIVAASKKLRTASLILADGRPLVPELFWSLADEWRPRSVALAHLPPAGEAETHAVLDANLNEGGTGWTVAGTVGAAVWGAPLAIGIAYPPDFYVQSAAELRQGTIRFGEAMGYDDRACTVAVAPTPLACVERFDRQSNTWGGWRFAHGLFAALDLAQDRSRGTEILSEWEPKDFTRVW